MTTKRIRLVAPGSKLQVDPGDTIRVLVEFTYVGPDFRETLYGALYAGEWGVTDIDEVSGGTATKGWDIPATPTPTTIRDMYVDVPVPNRPGETYGIYVKLGNVQNVRGYDNVIEIRAVQEVTGLRIAGYAQVG